MALLIQSPPPYCFCPLMLPLLALLLATSCARFQSATAETKSCTSASPLVGFTTQLSMLQHQLRGQIEVLDDCSFRVTKFDMIAGTEVYWWGAVGDDFENLTNGFIISDIKLNKTYSNQTLVVTLSHHKWEDFRVLAVWDKAFDADFGHAVLAIGSAEDEPSIAPSPDWAPVPAPAPSMGNSTNRKVKWGAKQPTMFDNCIPLSPSYRLRWTLDMSMQSIDLGLEAAMPETQYMAFGWARPGADSHLMMNADVVVAGFRDHTAAFAEDYHITKYSECTWGNDEKPLGVCPDFLYAGTDNASLVSNTKFVHGQWQDGVSFIRYSRSLQSPDKEYDVAINATEEMTVIWSFGPLKLPDSIRPLYLPGKHNLFGQLKLNLSKAIDTCSGPLEGNASDAYDLIDANTGSAVLVTAGLATHYPNPPNPDKVIFLNKIEAPVLKVERGVDVIFSIQAGHDVALCITNNPVGGSLDSNATIYAGGPDAHGVPASPYELKWQPNRLTPDEVFYQSFFQKKMGWKVQVVDGGLTDMYNSSVLLADHMVALFWMLTESGISFAVQAQKKSGYVAIGFGEKMVNTFAYVGWLEGDVCHVSTYWIDGRDPSSIHATKENLTDVSCMLQNGLLTFQFSRPLDPSCSRGQECRNIIDPLIPLKVVWALGTQWKADELTERNMHSSSSTKYMSVHLTKGVAEAEQELRPVLAVHGFMMFLAWALLFPGGVLAARYLKHLKDDGWFQIHVYSQYSGIAVMLLGVLFAVAELRDFRTHSWHVKIGLASIFLACWQPVNAFFRPKVPTAERPSSKRLVWVLLHVYSGRAALALGFVTLLSGIYALQHEYGGEQMRGLSWALVVWFLSIAGLACYLEYRQRLRSVAFEKSASFSRGSWVMGNANEEDDSAGLLMSNHAVSSGTRQSGMHKYPSNGMEVQLQAMR